MCQLPTALWEVLVAVTEGGHPRVTPAWDPQGREVGKKGTEKPRGSWGLQELGGIPRQEETTEAVRCFHPPEFANKVVATELISVTLPCHLNLILDV